MTFKTRKHLPDLCSFLITAKHYLALLASSFTTSLLLLFAVTSFMSVVSWQNSKSNRENFGVILWVLKRIFFLLFPTAPSKEILMYHYFIANNILHLYSTFQLTKCFYRYSFKVHMAEGGQWEDLSPLDMTPGRGEIYILPLKVFFYAMPFPARQQGGLTGDYVSLPGYTETKQRVRQDHPPLTPLPPSATSVSPTDSLCLCFWHLKFPSSTVVFRNSDLYFSVDSARIPLASLVLFLLLPLYLPLSTPTLSILFHFFFPSIKKFKCTHPPQKLLNKTKKKIFT